MEFGKLPNVDQVDFRLPADPAATTRQLAHLEPTGTVRIYIGPTGYNTKEWVGTWYPAGTKERDFLKHFGQQFNTIEHNTTHYRIPDDATVDRWIQEVPDDFRYCPKIPQIISHARDLGAGGSALREFIAQMHRFQPRLGCCFMQLPPHFDPSRAAVLKLFMEYWPATLPLAVEVRHEAFFEATDAANAWFDLLRAYDITAVITDVAGRRDVCHLQVTTTRTMIRFVGNNFHPSDTERVQDWAKRLAQWTQAGVEEVYFFGHQPDNIQAPELAALTAQFFSVEMPRAQLRGPRPVPAPAVQGSLF
jgi:uncharacterized protein YecE (DUF72 family)